MSEATLDRRAGVGSDAVDEVRSVRGRQAIAAYWDARRCVDAALAALAAERRSSADVTEILRAVGSIVALVEAGGRSPEVVQWGLRLRDAVARAARNRYLADISSRLRDDGDGATWHAHYEEEGVACLESLVDAIVHSDSQRARRAAEAEIDMLERSSWQRLEAVGGQL